MEDQKKKNNGLSPLLAKNGSVDAIYFKKFITGVLPTNTHIIEPKDNSLPIDENGQKVLTFDNYGRGRILAKLREMYSTPMVREDKQQECEIAYLYLSAFLNDIAISFQPNDAEATPTINYKLFSPEQVIFCPTPESELYKEYAEKLTIYNDLVQSSQSVSPSLTDFLTERESTLFYGVKNEQDRADAMDSAVQQVLNSTAVQIAILHLFFSEEEFIEILERRQKDYQKKGEKKAKSAITIEPYRKAGHLVDQSLKYTYPPDTIGQLSLFDSLNPKTQEVLKDVLKIEKDIEKKAVVEGIRPTPAERKIIDCLCKLLHIKSQTKDPKANDYYMGSESLLIPYGEQNQPAPKLAFTLYEITKEYKGGESINGKDTQNVRTILDGLERKRFLIKYTQRLQKKGGGTIEQHIEGFTSLLKILKVSGVETDSSNKVMHRTDEFVVLLNPIFTHQIDNKFIECPPDLNRRTIIAYGSHNLSDASVRLRDYLMREKSASRSKCEINVDRLHYILCETWMKEGRKKKVIEYTEKAIETSTALGLLTKHEVVKSKSGEPKVIFHINKEWK